MRCTMAGEKRAHWLHSASYCAVESAVSLVTCDREVLHTGSSSENMESVSSLNGKKEVAAVLQ